MKIHYNTLTPAHLYSAARAAQVTLERSSSSGSRTHAGKIDVILSGNSGRRAGFGADHEAATWDQWGIFLQALFVADPTIRCAGAYETHEQFRKATGNRFDTLTIEQQHKRHNFKNIAPYVNKCQCGAIRDWSHSKWAQQTREIQAAQA